MVGYSTKVDYQKQDMTVNKNGPLGGWWDEMQLWRDMKAGI